MSALFSCPRDPSPSTVELLLPGKALVDAELLLPVKLRVDAEPELLLPVELFFDAEPAKAVVGAELLLSADLLFPVFFLGAFFPAVILLNATCARVLLHEPLLSKPCM